MNIIRTGLLMAAMTGLFLVVGYLVGGGPGMLIAFLFAAGSNLFAYWNSDKVLLSMYGAREVDERTAPELVHLVRQLSANAGLPMPKAYIVDNPQPNAFATGRDPEHAAVCVMSGLLSRLNNEELAGVLAHELSHVKNRDTLAMTITATIAGAISMLANFAFFFGGRSRNPLGLVGLLLVTLLAPVAAVLVQMAVSRSREFEADRSGAELSGRPLWLASALQHIEADASQIDNPAADANPATAHMFIINPLHGGLSGLFSSHPSTEERVARLRAMAARINQNSQPRPLVVTAMPVAAGEPARLAAQAILSTVLRRRKPLDLAQDQILSAAELAPRDTGFARAIAGETLRRFGQLDALLRECLRKPLAPHRSGGALDILLAGACELLFLDLPAHAAVDAANRLAARDEKAVHFKPLINATLRRLARDGRAMIERQDAPRLNTPDWLWNRWCDAYGEETARAIAGAHATPAPLDIMVARGGSDSADFPNAVALPGNMLRLKDAGRVEALPGFVEGAWWVQDFAAGLPARLLGDVRGKTVIDLCAAPGGKTAQLASMGANVIAVEREPARMARLKDNLARLSLPAAFVEADIREFAPDEKSSFVLLDAPCSATGTIRRHPEIPWIKSAADVNSCAEAARELLDAAAAMVAAGGILLFAVCSLEREEGFEQAEDFLRRHPEFRRDPVRAEELFGHSELIGDSGDLRTLPCHFAELGGMDGFYAARFRRL